MCLCVCVWGAMGNNIHTHFQRQLEVGTSLVPCWPFENIQCGVQASCFETKCSFHFSSFNLKLLKLLMIMFGELQEEELLIPGQGTVVVMVKETITAGQQERSKLSGYC